MKKTGDAVYVSVEGTWKRGIVQYVKGKYLGIRLHGEIRVDEYPVGVVREA